MSTPRRGAWSASSVPRSTTHDAVPLAAGSGLAGYGGAAAGWQRRPAHQEPPRRQHLARPDPGPPRAHPPARRDTRAGRAGPRDGLEAHRAPHPVGRRAPAARLRPCRTRARGQARRSHLHRVRLRR
ncbi:hypothetical protein EEJ42_08990 [Streptomyces botrytidirepellens]|uniref:Uncharacterized protein n=1 Tax=Streptomyces botrytidirepellens TaxID=2486417 RepID=A0A3M8WSP5_9ACTN|nr:hypothetical protein EEJ42_08990 [Streptomyces botrytidirepellens]